MTGHQDPAMVHGEPETAAQRLDRHLHADEASLTAGGYAFVTVIHGDPAPAEEEAAADRLRAAFWTPWAGTGRLHRTVRGGNDYSVFIAGGPGAAELIGAVRALADQYAGRWSWWATQDRAWPDWAAYQARRRR